MVPLFKRTDVPSRALLSFTQKTLLLLPFVKRFYSSSYCVCELTCVDTKGQCPVSSSILQPIFWDSLPLNLLFATLIRLAGQRAMGIHPSLRCQVLELQMYATMPLFYGGPATLNADSFVWQALYTSIHLPDCKIIFPRERKMNPKCKCSTEEFGTRHY